MTTPDESPIIRTSSKRMAQGLAIVVIVMAVGAAIAIPNWHNMAKIHRQYQQLRLNPVPKGVLLLLQGVGALAWSRWSKQGGTVAGARLYPFYKVHLFKEIRLLTLMMQKYR